jgi:hypothetical protein
VSKGKSGERDDQRVMEWPLEARDTAIRRRMRSVKPRLIRATVGPARHFRLGSGGEGDLGSRSTMQIVMESSDSNPYRQNCGVSTHRPDTNGLSHHHPGSVDFPGNIDHVEDAINGHESFPF